MEALVESIKVRVPAGTRGALQEIADDLHLDLSDIVRQALREHVEARRPKAEAEVAS
jgi:predicted transcriptional regulator